MGWFADPGYLDLILNTGLDHLTLIFQADQERSWKALENCLATRTCSLQFTSQSLPRMPAGQRSS